MVKALSLIAKTPSRFAFCFLIASLLAFNSPVRTAFELLKSLFLLTSPATLDRVAEWNKEGAGLQEAIPRVAASAILMLKDYDIKDYRCAASFCEDSLISQRLVEGAYPAQQNADSRNYIGAVSSPIPTACKVRSELNGVRLYSCD